MAFDDDIREYGCSFRTIEIASTATTTATGSHGVAGQPDSQTAVCQSTGGAEGRERDVRGGGGGGGGGGCSYVGTCGGASPVQAAAAATTAVSVVGVLRPITVLQLVHARAGVLES
ncbi:hypothetical protein HZH68_016372 [Vespula germanica]|uniref:Uncharacterized protein n=1 Tax=Vespula germanica TaxID=30212 RepID=A0A834MPH6_VESGE|nr:hypothetical protein HZH68_016372 [Vespula germanica]